MEEETKKPNYKGVWGSGYHKGYRECANLLRDENMNAAKIKKISEGLTSIAAKVLDCVPHDEVSRTFVLQEMKRRGCTQPQTMIFGCLDTLKSLGLIKEHTTGQFVKIKANKAGRPKKIVEEVPTEPALLTPSTTMVENVIKLDKKIHPEKTPRDPMDIIVDMRSQFEEAMFEICEYLELQKLATAKRMKQLDHFKALMSSINEDNE